MEKYESAVPVKLAQYKETVSLYMNYVLIRSSRFASRKDDINFIAFKVFATAYSRLSDFNDHHRISNTLDKLVDNIGLSVLRGSAVNPAKGDISAFLADEDMRKIAQALNNLDRFSRLALVLYDMEKLSASRIGQMLDKRPVEIVTALYKAREQFFDGCRAAGIDTQFRLSELAGVIDKVQAGSIANSVICFLWSSRNTSHK